MEGNCQFYISLRKLFASNVIKQQFSPVNAFPTNIRDASIPLVELSNTGRQISSHSLVALPCRVLMST